MRSGQNLIISVFPSLSKITELQSIGIQQTFVFFRSEDYEFDAKKSLLTSYLGIDHEEVKNCEQVCGKPDEICGTIQAGRIIRPDLEDIIDQEFENRTPARKCGEILGKGILSCAECILLVGSILDDFQTDIVPFKQQMWYETGKFKGEAKK